jgi:molybdopterin converting factor small subunit
VAVVHIPNHWREHTGGAAEVQVKGGTLQASLRDLCRQHPALEHYLFDENDEVREEVAIAINSVVTENNPLDPVPEDAELYLVPAIAGGAQAVHSRC